MIGQTLAHYKILGKLGSGGMGDVYLAEDTKLDRKVALKVLPPELAESEERRARFKREAKALAALDHPNIVQVFSVEEADGIHFITMQLVHGKTLTELLPKNGFPLNKFFEIAIPMADAVAAAHQEGITHRDLKPDNMMVGDDGRIRVLDFGLAKPTSGFVGGDADSALPTVAKTAEGVIVGTVNYMSPEQAQGKAVDARSDIFSFGIVLYEMLTGRRPFGGDTSAEILSSIIKDAPPSVAEARPEVPRELSRMVGRCLAKEPTRRLQSALDVRNELEELKQDVDSGVAFPGAPPRERSKVKPWLTAAAIAVVSLALVEISRDVLRQPSKEVLRLTNPTQVTSALGVENYPTWSPEGQRLAYHSNQSGNYDIWVVQLAGGEPVNLTMGREQDDEFPSWSPDGSQIAFVSQRRAVYVMSALGGRPRKILSMPFGVYFGTPQWSADGTEIACPAFSGQAFVELVTLSSSETRRVSLPDTGVDLSWSPDGRTFAYVAGPSQYLADVNQIRVLPISGGEAISVTDGWTNVWSPTWSADGRSLFFVSNRGGSMDLWQQRMGASGKPKDEPVPLTTGLVIRSAVFSPDGTKLAYSRYRRVANVWRTPILRDRPATWADATQITFDEAFTEFLDLSPDGNRLAIASDRGGNKDLWLLPSAGGEMEQLTTDPAPDWRPSWSPDGTQIVFTSYRSGNRDLWVMPAGGGPARQLTLHDSADVNASWSPDGREIAFVTHRSGNWDVWTISAEGGEPRQLTDHPEIDNLPAYSPDGKWIAFSSRRDGVNYLFRAPAGGGQVERMTEGSSPTWSTDGKHLYFARAGNLWALSVEGGTEYPVTDLSGRKGEFSFEPSTHGQYLYFSWSNDIGDIWVMDVVTEQ